MRIYEIDYKNLKNGRARMLESVYVRAESETEAEAICEKNGITERAIFSINRRDSIPEPAKIL